MYNKKYLHLPLQFLHGMEFWWYRYVLLIFQHDFCWNFCRNSILADGLYELSFHNCFNLKLNAKELEIKSLKMALAEENYVDGERHYLSNGDMPLPMVYGFCSILFFVATFIWLGVLRQQNQTVSYQFWIIIYDSSLVSRRWWLDI